jgi:hypothetical protein
VAVPASPKLLGRVHAIVKHVGARWISARSRYAVGDSPTMPLNVRLNVPRLVKPTSRQISVTLRSVSRKRNIARSTRRRLEITMRRLAERGAEAPDEVRLGDVDDPCEGRDVERLCVGAIHHVPGAEQPAI